MKKIKELVIHPPKLPKRFEIAKLTSLEDDDEYVGSKITVGNLAGQTVKTQSLHEVNWMVPSGTYGNTITIRDKITFLDEAGNERSWPIVFVEPVKEEICDQLSKKARLERWP